MPANPARSSSARLKNYITILKTRAALTGSKEQRLALFRRCSRRATGLPGSSVSALLKQPFLQRHGRLSICRDLNIAKLYCVTLGNGDRFTQWPVPTASPLSLALPSGSVCQIMLTETTPNNSESDRIEARCWRLSERKNRVKRVRLPTVTTPAVRLEFESDHLKAGPAAQPRHRRIEPAHHRVKATTWTAKARIGPRPCGVIL